MIGPLGKLLPSRQEEAFAAPAVPQGQRVYAIGDIHGRLDLFNAMIEAIEAEEARREPAQTFIVLLGDLIDRGPDSAGVLTRAHDWQRASTARGRTLHILMGNHEEMLLESVEKLEVLRHFVNYGGKETILSFGISQQAYAAATWEELQAMLREAGAPYLPFVADFEPIVRIGDYAFVHAGIRPGEPLDMQAVNDLRWIREPFLSSDEDHGAVVVHGHTIADEPVWRGNRIGIDTGAYATGRLTALVLESSQRWFISTSEQSGSITTSINEAA